MSLSQIMKNLARQEDVTIVLVVFLDVKDIVRLARTCRRISKILKYPEVERLLLRKKAALLE